MRYRNAQVSNLFFQPSDERIELWDFTGVLTLLMLAEAVKVSLVLWPPAMEEESILFDDGLSQFLDLIELRAASQSNPIGPFSGRFHGHFSAINSEGVLARP